MSHPDDELEKAKATAEQQLEKERERSKQARGWAAWWVDQRERNNFRGLLEELVRGS